MKTKLLLLLVTLVAGWLLPASSFAQNTVVTYQGRVTSHGTNFTGPGQFKLALVTVANTANTATAAGTTSGGFLTIIDVTFGGNGYVTPPVVSITDSTGSGAVATANISGGVVTSITINNPGSGYSTKPDIMIAAPPEILNYTTYWSNDGTSSSGSEPSAAVTTSVTDGLFTVRLGDATVANMTALPTNLFLQSNLHLRLWFNDGVNGFGVLSPTQPLTAAPYAATARGVTGSVAASQIAGVISSNNIGVGSISSGMLAAGAVGSNQLAAGAVTTSALANGAVTAAKVATASNWIALTLANPVPYEPDAFGYAVAAVGTDRVLIGAESDGVPNDPAGAAYLFSTDGALLSTFTAPLVATGDQFGWSVAAVDDRLLIGAPGNNTGATDAGAAYLLRTNGSSITFLNPTPAVGDNFGHALAAVGSNRVLISAPSDNTAAANAGAAYLFSTNGTLITTFIDPLPAANDAFGSAVAVVGSEYVLIGICSNDLAAADSGQALIFRTNGILFDSFANPSPAVGDLFGCSVAAVGNNRVLIGAYGDDTGAVDAGAAYLFNTNGTLITTFTNPAPAVGDQFGFSVAAMGSDRVLIGARRDDAGATDSGTVYLFRTNGVLLATLNNPVAAAGDFFGSAVAAVGGDRILVGAYQRDAGDYDDAGAAYLFTTENFAEGLVAEAVLPRAITTASLEDGAVTLAKLDPSIGVWEQGGNGLFLANGDVQMNNGRLIVNSPLAPSIFSGPGGVEIDGGPLWVSSAIPSEFYSEARFNARLIATGDVGIGTYTPATPLHVYSANNPAVVRIQSTGAPGFGRVEFVSNPQGDFSEWRPGYIQSSDAGNFTGGLRFVVNGTGPANKFGEVETMRIVDGRVGIGTVNPGSALHVIGDVIATAFFPTSDRNLKENFAEVSAREVLDKVAALPISRWNFKGAAATPHIGPMAQDFHAAFGVGLDDKHIATVDADGVALAAIQGLNQKLEAENAALKARLDRLEQLLIDRK